MQQQPLAPRRLEADDHAPVVGGVHVGARQRVVGRGQQRVPGQESTPHCHGIRLAHTAQLVHEREGVRVRDYNLVRVNLRHNDLAY